MRSFNAERSAMRTDRPHVWIVLLNFNGWADTRKCLASLERLTYERWSAVLVENASAEDHLAAIESEFPWCHTLRRTTNGGWAGGNNSGIQYALERGADQVVLLNNDTTVAPNLLDRLISAAEAHPEYGVIGPVIRFMEPPHEVMTDGCTYNDARQPGFLQRLPVPLEMTGEPAVTPVDIVNGCCMMVARRVFEEVGLIDERFFLVHEESDFCLRAGAAGFACGVLGEALIWHKGSSSFKRTGRSLQRYYDARNLLLLLGKHPRRRPEQRGFVGSRWEYLKSVYYRYALEREASQPETADAILEGVSDALKGRYGSFVPGRRTTVPVLRWVFESYRGWRSRLSLGKGESRAVAVRQG